jgi:hypothetical protein
MVAGWNYMVRLYRPRAEVLDGTWKFPGAQPANQASLLKACFGSRASFRRRRANSRLGSEADGQPVGALKHMGG